MLLLVLGLAIAHEPGQCPPLAVLDDRAGASGRLSDAGLACARGHDPATARGQAYQWLLWRDRLARQGPTEAVLSELGALLAVTTEPEPALRAAEALAPVAADPARRALARARASSFDPSMVPRMIEVEVVLAPAQGPVMRAQAFAALGMVGEPLDTARAACLAVADPELCARPVAYDLPAATAPAAAHVAQCLDLNRAWSRAALGGLYQTDRDCLARLLDAVDGAPREVAGHLALGAALTYRDRVGAVAVAHRVAAALPDDAVVAGVAAALHREHGDVVGADWWTARAAELSRSAAERR